MNKPERNLETEALKLPASERARLAELLIASLRDQEEVERAWQEELARRLADLKSGSVETIPSKEVFDELDALVE